jgi:hypothetical protein
MKNPLAPSLWSKQVMRIIGQGLKPADAPYPSWAQHTPLDEEPILADLQTNPPWLTQQACQFE